jgi:hypothetical protein
MATKGVGVLIGIAMLLSAAVVVRAAQILSATTDVNGRAREATTDIDAPSYVRCTSANGEAGEGPKPSCQIGAPGVSVTLEVGRSVSLEKAGIVRLTCNGKPPLRCTAQITP